MKISDVYFVNSEKSDTFAILNEEGNPSSASFSPGQSARLRSSPDARASHPAHEAPRPQATETAHQPGWRNR